MSDVDPGLLSHLDQLGALCSQAADITAAYRRHLVEGGFTTLTAEDLATDFHRRLLRKVLFKP